MVIVNIRGKCSICQEFHPFDPDTEGKFICKRCKEILAKIEEMEMKAEVIFAEMTRKYLFYLLRGDLDQLDQLLIVQMEANKKNERNCFA